jgi:hypothetical protein
MQFLTVDSFWGFYLGRPFRMNAGDITVPKPASGLTVGKEDTWRPYGLPTDQEGFDGALKNPNELISRQFAVLWEIISPLGHVLYVHLLELFGRGLTFLDMDVPTFRAMNCRGSVTE